jgi:hypothetical protein
MAALCEDCSAAWTKWLDYTLPPAPIRLDVARNLTGALDPAPAPALALALARDLGIARAVGRYRAPGPGRGG